MKEELEPLARSVENFAVAALGDEKVFMTGGETENEEVWDVSAYDLNTNKWSDLPHMNHKRRLHCSLCLNGFLFVLGGFEVNSIESFKIDGGQKWSDLQTDQLIERSHAAVTALDESNIAVFGGAGSNDGYVYNLKDKQVRKILGDASDTTFHSKSQVQMHMKGSGGSYWVTIGMNYDDG